MEKMTFQQVNEVIYKKVLDNGLEVYVLPKKGFRKAYATFTTKYGSIDLSFISNGEKIEVPEGIAHFLEHKMFEEEEGDVFNTFAIHGAQANAFTSFDRTAYLFSSTTDIQENIETLIDFVQNPYFTDENVEKEKGIIAQEIQMYQDNPDWQLYFGLIKSLYQKHPVQIDIAGTVDSIYKITKEQLYQCYNTFYHPSNMVLFIVGNIEPEETINRVENNQKNKTFQKKPMIERIYPAEPKENNQNLKEQKLAVAIPKVLVGFKDLSVGLTGKEFIKRELATALLLEMLFGQSSIFFEELTTKGLIDNSFSFEYQIENNYAFTLIGGNSINPEQLINELKEEILKHQTDQTSLKELFERSKRKKIGELLKKLNYPEYIANQFTRYLFNKANLFDILPTMEEITLMDIQDRLQEFDPNRIAISIVRS